MEKQSFKILQLKETFGFLISKFGFHFKSERDANYGCKVIYSHEKCSYQIHLNIDYRENFFYFEIVRNPKIVLSGFKPVLVIPFFKILLRKKLITSPKELQPKSRKIEDFKHSLNLNAVLISQVLNQKIKE